MTDPIPDEAVEEIAASLCVARRHLGDDACAECRVEAANVTAKIAPIIAAQATADLRARIEALHSPVHVTFSWDRGLQMNPICGQCHGKAGVHPCGCWADDDLIPECGECTERQGKRRVVTWPCPTIRALDALIGETPERAR